MPYFTPPTRDDVNYEDEGGSNLFSRLRPTPRGVNVFVTATGEVTENQPSRWEDVSVVYFGGHRGYVTDEEAAVLIDAGYGAYIEA